MERYTVISADCHAGGKPRAVPRVPRTSSTSTSFDEWRGRYSNPFRDLQGDGRTRNWDDERRIARARGRRHRRRGRLPEHDPAVLPDGPARRARRRRTEDFELRLAGLRAHNRWLADFCAAQPGRRAGMAQIFLNDVDEAVDDIRVGEGERPARRHPAARRLAGHALDRAAVLAATTTRCGPRARSSSCRSRTTPGAAASPTTAHTRPPVLMFVMETGFFANRALWHLTMSGVFERFPRLRFVMTEQGAAWVPGVLAQLDGLHRQMLTAASASSASPGRGAAAGAERVLRAATAWSGASFPGPPRPRPCPRDRHRPFMWGSDYPHHEATTPSPESLCAARSPLVGAGLAPAILAGNAGEVYGFDLPVLESIAASAAQRSTKLPSRSTKSPRT